jgi:choline dehydrogenase
VGAVLLRPESRGSITIKSSDPSEHPSIRPGYLQEESDLLVLLAGARYARKLVAAPPFQTYRGDEVWPGVDKQTDKELADFVRENVETLYHPIGTCKMGSDASAVVDNQLRVRGLTGLRVADASIMPTMIGGHINAPAIMIGEKAADLVRATP